VLILSFLSACGPSFELKSYPQFTTLNSQVVEQSNSRLQRIKGSLSYMTQANFIKHCKFYLWDQNDVILSKLWFHFQLYVYILYHPLFIPHLAQRAVWNIVISWRLSTTINIFIFFSETTWPDWNQILLEWSLDGPLS
jgi:small-conductance mechanosensitive channel